MPKSKPKKKKDEDEMVMIEKPNPPTEAPVVQEEEEEPEPINPELLKTGTCLRIGLEHFKMQIIGARLLPFISRAYVAYKVGLPVNVEKIFSAIEKLDSNIIKDIETFESHLFPEIETFLASKKHSK